MTMSAASPEHSAPLRQVAIGPDLFEALDVGSGEPVVFLHGAPGDWRTFAPHCALLSDRYRCVSYTQRHFGAGAWRADSPPFGLATHAVDLAAFVEALACGPAAVVAWSYAGHAALHAALTRPELFSSILIYEPGVPSYVADADELAAYGASAQAMFGPIAEAVQAGDLEEGVRRLIDASGGPGAFDRLPAERRAIALENAHVLPLLFTQTPPPAISCAQLAALPVSVTIAWGARSQPAFTVPARAAARCIGGNRHTQVPDVGHLWPEGDPEGFTALLRRWLEREL